MGHCNETTDKCEYTSNATKCQESQTDFCKVWKCDDKIGCYAVDVSCDDSNPCTTDECVSVP